MYILGISAFYHDSAACILRSGEILAAAQEERFTRRKHDESFPSNAIRYCIEEAEILPNQIDRVVFYEKPFHKFDRLLETYLAFAPKGFLSFSKSMPIWLKEKLFQKTLLIKELKNTLGENINWKDRLLFSEHHLSHAASAYYPSPFKHAAVLCIDGVGEWTTTSVSLGKGNNLELVKEIHFPHSLGLLYSAFTYYTGFKVNSGEYKLMGLAPYGSPKYVDIIKNNLIHLSEDGSFQLDMKYFNFATGLTMTNEKFNKLFGGAPRKPEAELTQREMDIAASIQKVTEEIVIKLAKCIANETGEKNLCLAGGVALNCVINGILHKEEIFDNIWIQPAAGDAGGALGAALSVWHLMFNGNRENIKELDAMRGAYLGPSYSAEIVSSELKKCGANFTELDSSTLLDTVSSEIADGKAIGWMQGRMEFGPRALGNRSIIADARSPKMQKQLNLKVKFRESFRPFAPSILYEDVRDWFAFDDKSPYMLMVADIAASKQIKMSDEEQSLFGINKLNIQRSQVPAVTHVDYSARIQTVHVETNPKFHALISKFKEKTNCSVIVNTSFNVRGEPIVCSPSDAFKCFMGTDLDILVVENFIMYKAEQDVTLAKSYEELYDLD